MTKVSVIIPARNEKYLQNTIDDLLKKAKDQIDIIVVLDGYWPIPYLKNNDKVIIIHKTEPEGMRAAINSAAKLSRSDYLMKCDAHCMFDEGFDVKLKANCEDKDLVVPSRYSLDVDKWERKMKFPYPTEYNYLTFPYVHDNQFGTGLHGKKWTGATIGPNGFYEPEIRLKDKKIDEIITFQGSCWFMKTQHFFDIDMLDCKHSYNMYQEAQELGFKTWLTGGRILVNKNTWYAHWHKDSPQGYGLSNQAKRDSERFHTWYWMNDKYPKAVIPIKQIIDKFMPLPGWPENWEEIKKEYESKNPELWIQTSPRIFNPNGYDGLFV